MTRPIKVSDDGRYLVTAEGEPFSEEQFAALMALARKGIARLVSLQQMAVG